MRNEKGFSYVEVLVSLTILVLVLVPSINLFGQSLISIDSSTDTLQAINAAQGKLEELRVSGYGEIVSEDWVGVSEYPGLWLRVDVWAEDSEKGLKSVTVYVKEEEEIFSLTSIIKVRE